jgi:hypothetical protein
VDPLTASYPWYTPYQFAGNKPIKFIDLDGLEEAERPITVYHATLMNVDQDYVLGLTYLQMKASARNIVNRSNADESDPDGIFYEKWDVVVNHDGGVPYTIRHWVFEDYNDANIGQGVDLISVIPTVGNAKGLSGPVMLAKGLKPTVMLQIQKMLAKDDITRFTKEAAKLVDAVSKFENKTFRFGKYVTMLDSEGLTHILGRHHPKYRVASDKATQSDFAANMTVEDITSTIGRLIENSPDQMRKIFERGKGNGSFVGKVDGVEYQLGFKDGKIGQFHPME